VWAGRESYQYPPDYASVHYTLFTFPWSHGLVPLLVGIAVVSHFVLDGLVPVKGLPGAGTWELGLGLWRHLPVEMGLEAVMTLAGLVLYWRAARENRRWRRIGMVVYIVLLGAMAIGGQATSAEPAGQTALIVNWITAPVIFAAIAWSIDSGLRGFRRAAPHPRGVAHPTQHAAPAVPPSPRPDRRSP